MMFRFGELPVEIQDMTVEEMIVNATFTEVVSLRRVCKRWSKKTERYLERWFGSLGVGYPLDAFGGSDAEIGFLISHTECG